MAKYTGVESIDYAIERLKKNPSLVADLKRKLQQVTSQVYLDAQTSTTFCHRFLIPSNLPNILFKIYGVPEEKIKQDFRHFGMHTNKMYEDPYYQSLLILYLAGVYLNDEALRKLSLFLILIKLYNGRIYVYFRVKCDDEIASYIIRNKLSGLSLFKEKTPLQFLSYYIDTLESKYLHDIKRDPLKYTKRLFEQAWGRINQVFRKLSQLYYEAHKSGEKDISVQTVAKNEKNELSINDSLFESTAELIIDKYKKAKLLKAIKLPPEEKKYLAKLLTVTESAIDKVEEYINNEHNSAEVTAQLHALLKALKVSSENDLHRLPIVYSIDTVLGRKTEPNSVKFKEEVDASLSQIFGPVFMKHISVTQKLKLRKLYSYILFYQLKAIISKTKRFERK